MLWVSIWSNTLSTWFYSTKLSQIWYPIFGNIFIEKKCFQFSLFQWCSTILMTTSYVFDILGVVITVCIDGYETCGLLYNMRWNLYIWHVMVYVKHQYMILTAFNIKHRKSIYEGLQRPRWSQFASEIYNVYGTYNVGTWSFHLLVSFQLFQLFNSLKGFRKNTSKANK